MGVEEVIASILEKSVIAGAFMYMLHYFLTKQERHQERQTQTLESISDTLAHTSDTLVEVCNNMASMDKRIQKLEERGGI